METLTCQRLSEMVAGRIKQLIIDESLKPGDRLPTELEMAEYFGVSRASVREATKALAFLGIISSAPRRGSTLGIVDMKRVTEYLGFHLALNNYPKTQLLRTRIVIETGGLPYVAEKMQQEPELYDQFNELVAKLRRAKRGGKRLKLDLALHRALLKASGAEPLLAIDDLLQIFFNRFRKGVLESSFQQGLKQHQRIIDALRDEKVRVAQDVMRKHLEGHKQFM